MPLTAEAAVLISLCLIPHSPVYSRAGGNKAVSQPNRNHFLPTRKKSQMDTPRSLAKMDSVLV